MTGGQATIPVTFMALNMGGGAAGQHSDNTAAYFVHTPGLKVVMPSTLMMPKDCSRVPYVMIIQSFTLWNLRCS